MADLPARHPLGPRRVKTTPAARPRLGLLKRVSEHLGVPYCSMRTCAANGEFPIITIGRLQYVEWAAIDRWIESRAERKTA